MPKVSDAHRASRREQTIDAALRCFVAKGFHRTSMADIIADAELSSGAIYLQFASKQQIAIAVARRALGGRRDELQQLLASGAPPEPGVVLELMLNGLEHEDTDLRVIVQIWGEAAADDDIRCVVLDAFDELRKAFHAVLAAWAMNERAMTATQAEAYVMRLVPLMLGMGQGYLLQKSLIPDFDGESYIAEAKGVLAAAR